MRRYNLPVIYVCENNLYGVGTRQSQVRKIEDIAERSVAYGMPGCVVDGNDVMAVYEATYVAVDRARAGEGPTLIECKTYRWGVHNEGEADTYRRRDCLSGNKPGSCRSRPLNREKSPCP